MICISKQAESQQVNPVDPQAFQEKLSDILNPSAGGAAPNVTIQVSCILTHNGGRGGIYNTGTCLTYVF